MAIWVDADACPNVIKEILFRAAERTQTPLTLVANQPLRVPAGGGGAGEGRGGAEPARGTLQRGDDPRAADDAGFYGDITGQRRSDRRPG